MLADTKKTKDFLKFLSLVVILYLGKLYRLISRKAVLNRTIGFLTTFSLLARGQFSFREMSWILVKVFFGSSYLGFVSRATHKLVFDLTRHKGHCGEDLAHPRTSLDADLCLLDKHSSHHFFDIYSIKQSNEGECKNY